MPSWPLMPTPMCAAWIMPTSLAPSPMASVMRPLSLTSPVTSAFCRGDTRQHTTDVHPLPSDRKMRARSGSSAKDSERPSMTSPTSMSAVSATSHFALPSSSCFFTLARPSRSNSSRVISRSLSCFTRSLMLTTTSSMSSRRRLHAWPMLMAVSCLSPVSTHTAMPARISCSMHCGTPSCSLSSMAVAPSRMSSFSMISAVASIFSSRFSSDCAAAVYVLFHSAYCASLSSRLARHSVRSPLDA
mmetsp:Transcript_36314/g.89463  ORF Transcript_36314/g.89463 Transcript_36314/m.89463 type:complete len:244 (+) Transcript_36314:869-1600(+)